MDVLLIVSVCASMIQSDPALAGSSAPATPVAAETDDRPLIPRDLLFGNPQRAGVRISPDGSHLSYVAPLDGVLNVWVMPIEGGDARAVTASTDRPISNYRWAINGEQILYVTDTGGDENTHVYVVGLDGGEAVDLTPGEEVKASIAAQHRDRPDEILVQSNARDPKFFDMLLVDTRTGASSVNFLNDGGYVGMVPDDDWVVRLRGSMTPDGGSAYEYLDRPDGEWTDFETIGPDDSMTTQPLGFSRDGRTMWMLDSRGRDTNALFRFPAGETDPSARTLVYESDVSDIADSITNPETLEPQALATNRLRREWTILDDSIRPDLEALGELSDGELEIVSRTLDDRTWVVAYLHDDGPVRYWVWDRDRQSGRYLFSHRPDLEGVQLSSMDAVEIPTRDGLSMPSYLTVPHHASGEALPMVLLVHGGPWARDSWGYNPYHQWLADRGYAVLSVNFRGSTGFGKDYLNAGNREWYGKMQDDLVDAVDWAVKRGVADPDRVAIMGGSYGGYATLAGLTRDPDLFACGVDIVGPSHVGTLLETIPPYWEPIKVMFETKVCPFDDTEFIDRISPLTHVDNIRKPLLIGQGANDPRVKISESDQIVAAMDAKGIAVTYVVFPDEGHGFARPENNKAFNAITEEFLARHLDGRFQPLEGSLARSTAQLRRLGGLHLDGAVQWSDAEAPAPAGDRPRSQVASFEDLSPEQQAVYSKAIIQIDEILVAMKAQQGADYDESKVLGFFLQQVAQQRGLVPDEDLPSYDLLTRTLEARRLKAAEAE